MTNNPIERGIREKSFKELFLTSFYTIPLYQRGYSWDIYNLETLWEDINDLRYISSFGASDNSHFMSSILVKKLSDKDPIEHIVDGQQRITTIFLLLHAATDVLNNNKHRFDSNIYEMIQKDIQNVLYGDMDDTDPNTGRRRKTIRTSRLTLQEQSQNHPYNVLISKHGIGGKQGAAAWTEVHKSSRTCEAYWFFHRELSAIFKELDGCGIFEDTINVVLNKLKIIYIPILDSEAPQKIFESVNGLTKKLYAGELIKNYILMSSSSLEETNSMYKKYWADFDGRYWTEDDPDKERLTKMLYYWVLSKRVFIDRLTEEKVYRGFKDVAKLSAEKDGEKANEKAKKISYQVHNIITKIDKLDKNKDSPVSRVEIAYGRFHSMRAPKNFQAVFMAFLEIVEHLEDSFKTPFTEEQYNQLFLPLESYMVRKCMVNERSATISEYLINMTHDAFFPLTTEPFKSIDEYLKEYVKRFVKKLAEKTTVKQRFDSNHILYDAFVGSRQEEMLPTKTMPIELAQSLLIQVENHLSENPITKTGNKLTLEHWLPQESNSLTWPLKDELVRKIYTDSIGNMCVISQRTNSALSNLPLPGKINKLRQLTKQANPTMTKIVKLTDSSLDNILSLCEEPNGASAIWDEDKIETQARWVMKIILEDIFPDMSRWLSPAELPKEKPKNEMWDNPKEGRRIVANPPNSITKVRGYQTAKGKVVIDEVINMTANTDNIISPTQREFRAVMIAEAKLLSNGTYHWLGSEISSTRKSLLSIILGKKSYDDIWELEDTASEQQTFDV